MAAAKLLGAVGLRGAIFAVLLSVAILALSLSFTSLSLRSTVSLLSPFSGYKAGGDASLKDRESVTSAETEQHNVDAKVDLPEPEVKPSDSALPEFEKKPSDAALPESAGSNVPETSDGSVDNGKGSQEPVIEQPILQSDKGPISEGVSDNDTNASSSDATKDSLQDSKEEIGGTCDLYHGKWVYDPTGPLYTNDTCPIITRLQNCQGNGRPDKDYENWRWKPTECELPRFDPRKFLELLRDKTLAFVGDSVARNQMESLLCLLWQVEAPTNRGNRRMQKWYFRTTRTNIVRVWSSWLVHHVPGPYKNAPEGVEIVHLDVPDETFMDFLPMFDILVLSSGHWFAKRTAYVLNGTIVGGQLWWPKEAGKMQVNNVNAFGVSVETCLTAIANDPRFKGTAIVRSFSPDHYEGGAWNTGGSCTGKTQPVDTVVRNIFIDVMFDQQVTGYKQAVENSNGGKNLQFMNITEVFNYRPDGHPGPFRNPDPNKKTTRGPNGEPPPQDCLHWCLPGPIDTWNEILLELVRREYAGARS